jgi:hypothetical protein
MQCKCCQPKRLPALLKERRVEEEEEERCCCDLQGRWLVSMLALMIEAIGWGRDGGRPRQAAIFKSIPRKGRTWA